MGNPADDRRQLRQVRVRFHLLAGMRDILRLVVMSYTAKPFSSARFSALLLLVWFACASGFSQDAPQPQPAPGLSSQQQKAAQPPATPQPQPPPTLSNQQPKTAPTPATPKQAPATNQTAAQKPEKIIPAGAERHFHEAVLFERDGNAESAIEEYKAAIQEYPDYFEAHYNLGRLYLNQQGYTEAIAEFQTAVNLKPADANAHNNLGLALKHNRDLSGALAQYQEAVILNPNLASAHNNLANILYLKRDYTGAILHYRSALALLSKTKLTDQDRNNIAEIHMNLGSVLDDAGKSDDAIAEYKEAISLQPRDAKIRYNLSIVYRKKKDFPSAIAELRTAAKLAPDWPTPHIMLTYLLKDSDPKAALAQCVIADGLTEDAKLHDLCSELQKKTR